MATITTIAAFIAGLVLVVYFAEKLVEGVVGTARGFGVSAFVVSVVFIGFDAENLAVGAAGAWEGMFGIALGSVLGAAMVAVALAFGITAVIAPMRFAQAPRRILIVAPLAVLLLGALALDGRLSRVDGALLLAAYAAAVVYLYRLGRRGVVISAAGELAQSLDEAEERGRWQSLGLLLLALVAIVAGSELLVAGARGLIEITGIGETVFAMTVLALLVSIEELARELPAALKGRPDISFGNVVGSVLAFFLFNAGVIALVRPVPVAPAITHFYLPIAAASVLFICAVVATRAIPRWAGGVLVLLYTLFVVGAYAGWGG